MKSKWSNIIVAISILAIASLACQTVMGLVSGDEAPAEVSALEQEDVEMEAEPSQAEDAEPASAEENVGSAASGDDYRSQEGGFAFAPAEEYQLEEFFGMISMEAPGADPDYGPAFLLVGGLNEEEMTSEQLIDKFVEDSTADPDADITVSNRTSITIGGIDELMVDLSGTVDDQDVAGRVVVVLPTPTQQFSLFGFTPADQWDEFEPLFDAVLSSITFFEPTQIEFEFETDEDAATQAESELSAEPAAEEIRQWASEATASSEWGSTGWAAYQAAGEPDTLTQGCADDVTAWAAEGSDTVEWIELTYETAVVPSEIHIIQTYTPDQVVLVEVVDLLGSSTTVYTGEPEDVGDVCPYTLTVPVDVDFEVKTIKITLDQSILAYWNEIDAVELVGYPAGTEGQAAPAVPEGSTTEGVLWRFGGEDGREEGQMGGVDGMDVGPDGLLYVTDETFGIRIIDPVDGSQVALIKHDDFWQPTDVQVAPDGKVYVADWGANEVFIFSADWEIITHFGEDGNGPGQFGTFSPDSLAVSPDGDIYVLDDNETDDEEDFTRIQVFDADGKYLREFPIETDDPEIEEMDFGPEGNLYLVDWFGDIIYKYSPQGELLGQVGEEALNWAGPRDVAIDQAGNLYVAIWSPEGVMKLDPQGNLVAQFGAEVEDGEHLWPEGGFYSLYGVAVMPDGSAVFASDWSGYYSYITAFEFK
jgi:DNA-binding beta-propeller fold protein YncE